MKASEGSQTHEIDVAPSGSPYTGPLWGVSSLGAISMATVTKKDLIDQIAEATGQKRVTVKDTVQQFLDSIIDELGKGNRLEFRDFGVFEVKERAARTAQNPKTLERVHVPAKHVVKFKVGRLMKESVEALDEPSPEVTVRKTSPASNHSPAGSRSDR
jgi:integration host factor subunit beta